MNVPGGSPLRSPIRSRAFTAPSGTGLPTPSTSPPPHMSTVPVKRKERKQRDIIDITHVGETNDHNIAGVAGSARSPELKKKNKKNKGKRRDGGVLGEHRGSGIRHGSGTNDGVAVVLPRSPRGHQIVRAGVEVGVGGTSRIRTHKTSTSKEDKGVESQGPSVEGGSSPVQLREHRHIKEGRRRKSAGDLHKEAAVWKDLADSHRIIPRGKRLVRNPSAGSFFSKPEQDTSFSSGSSEYEYSLDGSLVRVQRLSEERQKAQERERARAREKQIEWEMERAWEKEQEKQEKAKAKERERARAREKEREWELEHERWRMRGSGKGSLLSVSIGYRRSELPNDESDSSSDCHVKTLATAEHFHSNPASITHVHSHTHLSESSRSDNHVGTAGGLQPNIIASSQTLQARLKAQAPAKKRSLSFVTLSSPSLRSMDRSDSGDVEAFYPHPLSGEKKSPSVVRFNEARAEAKARDRLEHSTATLTTTTTAVTNTSAIHKENKEATESRDKPANARSSGEGRRRDSMSGHSTKEKKKRKLLKRQMSEGYLRHGLYLSDELRWLRTKRDIISEVSESSSLSDEDQDKRAQMKRGYSTDEKGASWLMGQKVNVKRLVKHKKKIYRSDDEDKAQKVRKMSDEEGTSHSLGKYRIKKDIPPRSVKPLSTTDTVTTTGMTISPEKEKEKPLPISPKLKRFALRLDRVHLKQDKEKSKTFSGHEERVKLRREEDMLETSSSELEVASEGSARRHRHKSLPETSGNVRLKYALEEFDSSFDLPPRPSKRSPSRGRKRRKPLKRARSMPRVNSASKMEKKQKEEEFKVVRFSSVVKQSEIDPTSKKMREDDSLDSTTPKENENETEETTEDSDDRFQMRSGTQQAAHVYAAGATILPRKPSPYRYSYRLSAQVEDDEETADAENRMKHLEEEITQLEAAKRPVRIREMGESSGGGSAILLRTRKQGVFAEITNKNKNRARGSIHLGSGGRSGGAMRRSSTGTQPSGAGRDWSDSSEDSGSSGIFLIGSDKAAPDIDEEQWQERRRSFREQIMRWEAKCGIGDPTGGGSGGGSGSSGGGSNSGSGIKSTTPITSTSPRSSVAASTTSTSTTTTTATAITASLTPFLMINRSMSTTSLYTMKKRSSSSNLRFS
eukprot:TRINITY_DN4468_c0_g1_i2.p1 TRINITY_DN4468_c0_g1~~TRINITY_DN4468_c0_g1_i2.p1  ORF type:complete len:1136 (+),score=235.27 TRINITY_DN4468_c0_g1_i2:207-3614(+)